MTIESRKKASFFPARRQRIERWMFKDRAEIIVHDPNQSSFNTVAQIKHRFNQQLYQLGELRQRTIEQSNFNQKLFANTQALKHKDNPSILSTLNYVRKCCQHARMNIEETPGPIESEKAVPRPSPSRRDPPKKSNMPRSSMNESIRDIFLKHNRIAPLKEVKSQSAHQRRRSQTSSIRPITSAKAEKTPPPLTCPSMESISTQSRMISSSSSLREFRLHPERYLSPNNRYLPLLRRQATELKKTRESSSSSHGAPDLISEGAKSFLSEDLEVNSFTSSKIRPPTKINLMETTVDDDHRRRAALNSLRNAEYERLKRLIQSNSMEKIIEPMVEKDIAQPSSNPDLDQILQSIDSLGSVTDRHQRRRRQPMTNWNKTHSNLAILIF